MSHHEELYEEEETAYQQRRLVGVGLPANPSIQQVVKRLFELREERSALETQLRSKVKKEAFLLEVLEQTVRVAEDAS